MPVNRMWELPVTRAVLGEGPVWDGANSRLLWVDIPVGRIHEWRGALGEERIHGVGQPLGSICMRRRGGFVLAVKEGFAVLDYLGGHPEIIAAVEADVPGNRMNDGKCDSLGRFWAGTMAEDETPGYGSLYRLEPGGNVRRVLTEIGIPNGIGWSPDDRWMYFVDSGSGCLTRYSFDLDLGELGRAEILVAFPKWVGSPDGLTVDSEGALWVAMWGGGTVRRLSPTGELLATIGVPEPHVTSCTFGGDDLRTLFVTTERRSGGTGTRGGGVFTTIVKVAGLPATEYAG